MDYIVLFNRPLWINYEVVDESGEKLFCNIFGFVCKKDQIMGIDNYVDYLCGLSQWQIEGNGTESKDIWIKGKKSYYCKEEKIKSFCHKTRKIMRLDYEVYEIGDLDIEETLTHMLNAYFVTEQKHYEELKYNLTKVDVQNTPD